MKAGGGKRKGSGYEREVCKALSQWITNGHRTDVFWRSAISGGRATVAFQRGVDVRQGGDICSVSQEGHQLTDKFFIECKHVRSLDLGQFIFNGVGKLGRFWEKTETQAARHGRVPMIIARQNRWQDDIVLTKTNQLSHWCQPIASVHARDRASDIYLFSEWMKSSPK